MAGFVANASAQDSHADAASTAQDVPGYYHTPFPLFSVHPQWRQIAEHGDEITWLGVYVDTASLQFDDDKIAFVLKRTNARSKQQPAYATEIDYCVVKPQSHEVAYLVVQHFDGQGKFEQQQYADVGSWMEMDPAHSQVNAKLLSFLRGLPRPAPRTTD